MREISYSMPYTPTTLFALVLAGVLTSGALVSACDSGGSNGGGNSELIPLETGNSWSYERQGNTVSVSISGTRTVNGTEYYEFSSESTSYFADERGDGIFVRDSFDPEEFLLKYPVEDGEIYDYTDSGGVTYQVTVSKQSVDVEAGTFDAVKYEIEGPDPQLDAATFAPGVGLIRFEDGRRSGELVSYDVD